MKDQKESRDKLILDIGDLFIFLSALIEEKENKENCTKKWNEKCYNSTCKIHVFDKAS